MRPQQQGPFFAVGTPFDAFCRLLEQLSQDKGKVRRERLTRFFDLYGYGDYYAVYRLFLPALDKDRKSYQMKEIAIAKLYVDALAIDKNSDDGQRLLNYRVPTSNNPNAGDFGTAVYLSLRDRARKESRITVAQVNDYLDKLAQAADKTARKAILKQLLHDTTAFMQKWLVRIILKDLKIGMGEKVFLDFLHPDANSLYSVCTNLRRVCEELTDRTKRLENKMVQLFSCVKPMLAAQVGPGDVVGMMKNHDRGFVIETKFDGNRIQVHRSGSVFAYFSRKGINHVADYGHVLDPIMRECVRGDNYILDGELMTWLEDEQRFGKFKEVRSVGIQSRDNADYGTSDAGNKLGRLVYIVFDILMLNGQSLLQRPLFERIQILEQVVLVKDKRMEVVKRFVGRTTQDVEKALDVAIQNKEEGIIVKDLEGQYEPTMRKWIKIKPEYLHGVGDNMDLVILGAWFGEGIGGRSGTPSHFLLGVPAPAAEGASFGDRWQSFAKVGTGYTYQELSTLQYKMSAHWKTWDRARPPRFIELTPTAELPDVYVNPKECGVVLELRATSIEPSDKYCLGYTLRHPRVEKIRFDKGIQDCMKIEEVMDYIRRGGGQYSVRTYGDAVANGSGQLAKKKKAQKKKPKLGTDAGGVAGISVVPGLKPTDLRGVEKTSSLFEDKEFCVFVLNKLKTDVTKEAIEKLVVQQGGTLVQVPRDGTFCVITDDDNNVRVDTWKKLDKFDILRPSWLEESVAAGALLALEKRFVVFMCSRTRYDMQEKIDIFGDSFTKPILPNELANVVRDMQLPPGLEFTLDNAAHYQNKAFGVDKPFFALFSGYVFYVDQYDTVEDVGFGTRHKLYCPLLSMAERAILHYHGAVSTVLTPRVTHVLMNPNVMVRFRKIRRRLEKMPPHSHGRLRQLLSYRWVVDSCMEGTELAESEYDIKLFRSGKTRSK